jgi:hypothetical protein
MRNNRRIVGRVVFNVAWVLSRKVGDYFFPELLVYLITDEFIVALSLSKIRHPRKYKISLPFPILAPF